MKAPADAALSFLTQHSHCQSSAEMQDAHAQLSKAFDKGRAMRFFMVPIRKNLVSFKVALMWLALVHTIDFSAEFNVKEALSCLMTAYDLDAESLVTAHTLDDDEDEE